MKLRIYETFLEASYIDQTIILCHCEVYSRQATLRHAMKYSSQKLGRVCGFALSQADRKQRLLPVSDRSRGSIALYGIL